MKGILLILAAFLLVSCARQSSVIISTPGEVKVNVELAKTNEELEKGLMYRKSLDDNSGMLFIFKDEDTRAFWMKNTLIPLEMIFIADDGNIVDIKSAVPCKIKDCPLYISDYPAKYVLEVNSGFSKKHDIKIGNKAEINLEN